MTSASFTSAGIELGVAVAPTSADVADLGAGPCGGWRKALLATPDGGAAAAVEVLAKLAAAGPSTTTTATKIGMTRRPDAQTRIRRTRWTTADVVQPGHGPPAPVGDIFPPLPVIFHRSEVINPPI
jgi:hypothetical protein